VKVLITLYVARTEAYNFNRKHIMLCKKCGTNLRTKTSCSKCRSREWYQKNKTRRDAEIKQWKKLNPAAVRKIEKRSQVKRAYPEAVRQASNRNLSWDITEEDYRAIRSLPCHYCNSELVSPGVALDRIDNSQGYNMDNVLPCCGRCNLMRQDILSVEEMKAGMQSLKRYWNVQATKTDLS